MKVANILYNSILNSFVSKLVLYFFQFITLMVSARLFTPAEFGQFVLFQVVINFFSIITEAGIGPALINEKKISNDLRNASFSFTFYFGAICGLIVLIVGWGVDFHYPEQNYLIVSILVAISLVFYTANIVPNVEFLIRKKFSHLALFEIISEVLYLVLIVFLHNYVSGIILIAIKPIVNSSVKFLFCYYRLPVLGVVNLSFCMNLKSLESIYKYSLFQFLFNLLNFFSRHLDRILVSSSFSIVSLGMYDKANQLIRYPLLLSQAVTPAIQPVMKELKNDLDEFSKIFYSVSKKIFLVGWVISILMLLLSEDIVRFILGEQWLSIIPLFKVLTLIVPIRMMAGSTGAFYQSSGKVKLLFYIGIVSSFNNILAVILAISTLELINLCYFMLISFYINLVINIVALSLYVFRLKINRFFKEFGFIFILYFFFCIFIFKNFI
ncbi:oligosaccharide flippase family protein [Vibrio sp. 1569]|uniref:oligosaccharide flippase family protein n=1 Tax=Vibrio sp. 1569 TaxID=3074565 RepID=UPI002965741A|nr:oligosaccharide flippase family protein [Vibrio sp. 1569]MDW2252110.1 oligosaccharide flippase family protein [Vibrio sp. 1569]